MDEKVLLGNIKSLIMELETAISGGEELPAEMPVDELAKADGVDGEEKPAEEKELDVEKELVTSETDGAGEDATAEETIDSQITEPSLVNIEVISKEIAKLLMAKKSVKPAVKVSPVEKALTELTSVMKSMSDKQKQTDNVLSAMLEAQGVFDQLQVAKSVQPKPVVNQNNDIMKALAEMIQNQTVVKSDNSKVGKLSPSEGVRKSLTADVLTGLLG